MDALLEFRPNLMPLERVDGTGNKQGNSCKEVVGFKR
jgi:hypothetical protein